MRFALLAALVPSLLFAGFAGCLEGELSLLTAKDAREQADGEADDWADDAQLLLANGLEAGPAAREELAQMAAPEAEPGAPQPDDEEMEAQRAMVGAVSSTEDEAVGDGRAPVWVITYGSEEQGSVLHVVVTSQGVSSAVEGPLEEGAGFGMLGGQPVTDWRLDSDAGAEIAREDEEYARTVEDPDAVAYTVLLQGKDGPLWIYGAEAEGGGGGDGSDGAMVVVSAVDGTVIDADELLTELLGFVFREFGQDGGTVGAQAASTFGEAFEVQMAGHQVLVVLVSVSPPPVVPMQVTVTDPEGTQYTGTIDMMVGLESTSTLMLDAVPTGEYDVEVSVDVAVANTWEVSWCTDGVALVPQGSPACDLVPSSFAAPAASAGSLWETLSPLLRWASA